MNMRNLIHSNKMSLPIYIYIYIYTHTHTLVVHMHGCDSSGLYFEENEMKLASFWINCRFDCHLHNVSLLSTCLHLIQLLFR